MKVALFRQKKRHLIDFDPKIHKWRKQNGKFLIGHSTGLTGDLAQVFVKKWEQAYAPGHELLIKAINEQLPHVPAIHGHAADGGDHYYFMENKPINNRLLEKIITTGQNNGEVTKKVLSEILLNRNIGLQVANTASHLFEEINNRGFVYPDFTHKNIMVDWKTSECIIIDLDSCFKKDELPSNMRDTSGRFAITYWGVWREKIGFHTAEMLSRTMVLSFTAVWARAAAMLRASPDNFLEVQRTILNPNFANVQAPLWDSLAAGDRARFQAYFSIHEPTIVDRQFEKWTELYLALRQGQHAPWDKIREVAESTFEVARTASIQSSAPPSPTPARSFWPRLGRAAFSLRGRLAPAGYVTAVAALVGGFVGNFYVMDYVTQKIHPGEALIVGEFLVTLAITLWIYSASTIKRLRDSNINAYFFLVLPALVFFMIKASPNSSDFWDTLKNVGWIIFGFTFISLMIPRGAPP